jgi:hypothetical protein
MPDIEFKDLNRSIGTELFSDTESFLEDLTDDANIIGGLGTAVATIALVPTTTVYLPDNSPTMTTTVYNPPGGNSGINCTGFYTTVYNPPHRPHPPRPRHFRPIDLTYVGNDI